MFEVATCEVCSENESVVMEKGMFYCQPCLDVEFGAWRDHHCPQCGRTTSARISDYVSCYNTQWHNKKGGIRMVPNE